LTVVNTPGNRMRGIFLCASLLCSPASRAQSATLGVVQQASRAHLGQGAVTEGATVYAGEGLSTETDGALDLRVGSARFGLIENSEARFYPRPKGSVAELSAGTLIFRKAAGEGDVEVVSSDVRIVAEGEEAATGQVTVVSPCKIAVTSIVGQLKVTSGGETRIVKETESYSVIPEASVLAVRSHISPDDAAYHTSHTHKTCGEPVHKGMPASRFLLIGGAAAGVAGVLIGLHHGGPPSGPPPESPNTP
jgi:hypothetical protein